MTSTWTVHEQAASTWQVHESVVVTWQVRGAASDTPPPPQGPPGKSAYDLAVDDGFQGSLSEWLASLRGQDGTNGTDGTDGRSFRWRGHWDEEVEDYLADDVVLAADGSAYIALSDVPSAGVDPTLNPTYWDLMVLGSAGGWVVQPSDDGDILTPSVNLDVVVPGLKVWDGTQFRDVVLDGDSRVVTNPATQAWVTSQLEALLDGAPPALDTLRELAAAINNDADYAAAVTTALAGKQPLDSTLTALSSAPTAAFGIALLAAANAGDLVELAGGTGSTVVGSDGSVTGVVALTQAAYDSITPKPGVLYFITDAP